MIFFLLACLANGSTPSYDGWREIPPPRADLQCWTRFNTDIICVPSLTATHGASL
jgi:hypothetical protein